MIPCYQLIDVQIKNEKTQARPVAWDREIWDGDGNDKFGKPVNAVEFNTTCPFCANLIHFKLDELYPASEGGSATHIGCGTCGAAAPKVEVVSEDKEDAIEATHTTFKDPISSGLFGDEIDFDRLEKFDSAKSSEAV